MKLGILADIHEDVESLDAALSNLRREPVDRVVVLGDRQQIAADWSVRGFSCDLWTDPPGQRWEDFTHATAELVSVLEGEMEFEVEGDDTGVVDLPKDMVERLRVNLAVWKPNPR